MNRLLRKESNLQRELYVSLFSIQALAAGLPTINLFVVNFIIGKYLGAEALAAIGFVSPLNFFIAFFTAVLSTGMQILCGRYLGRGDKEGIRKTFSTSVLSGSVIGISLTLIVLFFPEQVAGLLGAEDELRVLVVDYLRGFLPSFFLLVMGSGFLLCLQMDNAKVMSTTAVVVQLVISVGFSFFFINIRKLGIFGAGLAMTLGNLALNLVCCTHFARSKLFRFSVRSFSADSLKEICTLGANSGLNNVWAFFRTMLANKAIYALGGTLAMSAFTVANSIASTILCTIENGLTGTTAILSSVLVGERDVKGLRHLHKTSAEFTLPLYFVTYFLIFVFAKPIALLFGAEPENIGVYLTAIRLINLWALTNSFKPPMSIYNALGKIRLVAVLNFLNILVYCGIVIGAGVLCSNFTVLCLFSVLGEIMLYMTHYIYYVKKTHQKPQGIFEVTVIPRSLSVPKKDTFILTVKTDEEAAKGAEALTEFCQQHGLDEKLSSHCGLCLEEVAVETISRFPEKDREKYRIEIRGIFENGHLSLMFHDDLPEFDPQSALKLYDPQNPDVGLNIKIVSSLAEEMKYSFTLGLNTLSIKL